MAPVLPTPIRIAPAASCVCGEKCPCHRSNDARNTALVLFFVAGIIFLIALLLPIVGPLYDRYETWAVCWVAPDSRDCRVRGDFHR